MVQSEDAASRDEQSARAEGRRDAAKEVWPAAEQYPWEGCLIRINKMVDALDREENENEG